MAILAPGAGERFVEGAIVEFSALVEDDATGLSDLDLSWRTTNGGALPGASDTGGRHDHVVEANLAPVVAFVEPAAADRYALGAAVAVVVSVTDDRDAPAALSLAWGDAAASLAGIPIAPDDSGEAAFTLAGLAVGTHRVTVTATDAVGATRTLSVDFEVVDADVDEDGFLALDLGATTATTTTPPPTPAPTRCATARTTTATDRTTRTRRTPRPGTSTTTSTATATRGQRLRARTRDALH